MHRGKLRKIQVGLDGYIRKYKTRYRYEACSSTFGGAKRKEFASAPRYIYKYIVPWIRKSCGWFSGRGARARLQEKPRQLADDPLSVRMRNAKKRCSRLLAEFCSCSAPPLRPKEVRDRYYRDGGDSKEEMTLQNNRMDAVFVQNAKIRAWFLMYFCTCDAYVMIWKLWMRGIWWILIQEPSLK